MVNALHVAAGLAASSALAFAFAPVAIRVAHRMDFFDRPRGYKGHAAPTPYLGGAAVVAAFCLAVLIAGDPGRTAPLVSGTLLLWVIGTVDDRRNLSPWTRLAVEAALAAGLWAIGVGWHLGIGSVADLLLTVVWIAAVINAFNLFDNMDGAASTMAATAAGGVVVLGVLLGDEWLMVAAAALCGACLGFLPYNLSTPARVFLGDGGSMPVGFAVAALVMVGSNDAGTAWQALVIGLMFVGVPAIDTCLVMVSRRRRGVPVLSGGRDHLTHRTRQRLRTARAVAVALGGAQAVLAALALLARSGGSGALVGAVLIYLAGAGAVIALADSRDATAPSRRPRAARALALGGAGWLVVALGAGVGASSFFSGFFDSTTWAPLGLGLLSLAVAFALARPLRPSGPAILTLAGLLGLGLWSLASSRWAESPHSAFVEGDRLLVLAAFLAVALLLVRESRRRAVLGLAALGAGALAVGGYELAHMLLGGREVLSGGRIYEPLGYVNGQGFVFAATLFSGLALAGLRDRPRLAGAGVAVVTACGGLVLLSQSRGALLAVLAGLVVVLAGVPGRLRRSGAVVVAAVALLAASGPLLGVYSALGSGSPVTRQVERHGALALLGAALAAGVAWGLAAGFARRAEPAVLARVSQAGRVAWIAGGAILLVAVIVFSGRIGDRLDTQVNEFTRPPVAVETASRETRLAGGESNRSEYWRIALEVFRSAPVAGIGAGSYHIPYFRLRRSTENVTQPHSIVFQTLSELGVVGAVLLGLLFGGLGWGIVRAARAARRSEGEAALVVAGAGSVAAWMLHASVDWIHLFPGLTAMSLLAAAGLFRARAPTTRAAVAPSGRRGRRAALVVVPVLALTTAIAVASLSRQALSEHYLAAAETALRGDDPAGALREADRSLNADGTAVPAYWAKAAALARLDRELEVGPVLRDAARHEPGNFVTYVLLGDHDVRSHDSGAARRDYGRSVALNPLDRSLRELARKPS